MNGIVYCIINKINNKKYIGQTVVGLKRRYHLNWWKYSDNNYLKHSVEKYGENNFEFEILENDISTIEKLNEKEKYYADLHNTYIPNGYNIRECGSNKRLNEETKTKLSIIKSNPWQLKEVESGKVIDILHLKNFCKENNLNYSAILNLKCGISDYSQGYVRIETDENTIKTGKPYDFMSPNGEVIRGSIKEIAKKYNIKSTGLYHLVNKQSKTYYGWSIILSSKD